MMTLGIAASAVIAQAAWAPTNVTGCIMWYDGAYGASIENGVSPKIAAWNDRSASNWRFFNVDTAQQPNFVLGGLKTGVTAVEFPNENYALNGPTSSGVNQRPLTAFAVVKHTGVARDRAILGTIYQNGFLWEIRPDHKQLVNQHNTANIGNSTSAVPSNTTVILCVTYDAAGTLAFYLNNVFDGGITNDKPFTATTQQSRIGTGVNASQGFVGTIGEIIKYDTVLSSTDRTTVYNYLAAKWTGIPLTIPGLLFWHDADDLSSFTLSGSDVAQWRDKSGASRHLNMTNPYRPTFSTGTLKTGRGSVDFNGSQSIETGADGAANQKPFSLIIVCKHSGTASERILIGSNPTGGGGFEFRLTNTQLLQARKQGGVTIGSSSDAVPSATTSIVIVTYASDGTCAFYRDGVSKGGATNDQVFSAATAMTQVGQSVGAAFIGSIGEVMKYDNVLSSTDRTTIYNYLAAKWL